MPSLHEVDPKIAELMDQEQRRQESTLELIASENHVSKAVIPHLRRLEYPAKEIFGFALPLIVVDLLFVVMNTTNVFMLQVFGSTTEVADYRVVQPAAKLNLLVMTSFALLFTPAAARLFARGDKKGINELYWSTAVWIAVFSFPVFALTFPAAGAVTTALFGQQYASSAPILRSSW